MVLLRLLTCWDLYLIPLSAILYSSQTLAPAPALPITNIITSLASNYRPGVVVCWWLNRLPFTQNCQIQWHESYLHLLHTFLLYVLFCGIHIFWMPIFYLPKTVRSSCTNHICIYFIHFRYMCSFVASTYFECQYCILYKASNYM